MIEHFNKDGYEFSSDKMLRLEIMTKIVLFRYFFSIIIACLILLTRSFKEILRVDELILSLDRKQNTFNR